MANQNDMEKLALLESIRYRAVHCIECDLETCPYDHLMSSTTETLRAEIHSDVAREMGIPNNPPKCPAKRRDKD